MFCESLHTIPIVNVLPDIFCKNNKRLTSGSGCGTVLLWQSWLFCVHLTLWVFKRQLWVIHWPLKVFFCPSRFLTAMKKSRRGRAEEETSEWWKIHELYQWTTFIASRKAVHSESRGIQRLRVTWFHLIFRPRSPLTRTSLTGRASLIKPTFIVGS